MRGLFYRTPLRFAADALFGLGVFTGLTAATLGPSAAAGLLGIDAGATAFIGSPALVQSLASSQFMTVPSFGFIQLAVVFSTLFALNFAFFRHLARSAPVPVANAPAAKG
jgi:hypothetical protein